MYEYSDKLYGSIKGAALPANAQSLETEDFDFTPSNLQELFGHYIDLVTGYAEQNQTCKRKAVGCGAVAIERVRTSKLPSGISSLTLPVLRFATHNGPAGQWNECSNEVGNCGCMHSEQKLIISMANRGYSQERPHIMVCNYSPCSNCANSIVYSDNFPYVVYRVDTLHDMRGLDILRAGGVKAIKLDDMLSGKYNQDLADMRSFR